jgi:hypothetical protein
MKYFKINEFDSSDAPGTGAKMKAGTLQKLDRARERAGIPFRINSGFRTAAHNRAVGGATNSAHTTGNAVDIAFSGRQQDFDIIVNALIDAGFTRIGVARNYIHADDSPNLPSPAVWIYSNDQTSLARQDSTRKLLQKKTAICPCCGRELD